jgi:hypothetical protein
VVSLFVSCVLLCPFHLFLCLWVLSDMVFFRVVMSCSVVCLSELVKTENLLLIGDLRVRVPDLLDVRGLFLF